MDPSNPFVDWLLEELRTRDMTREDLARAAGIKSTSITNVVNRQKNLGLDVAKAIARGLGVQQRVVFAIARLIDDEGVDDAKADSEMAEVQALIAKVDDPSERARLYRIIRAIAKETARRGR